MSELKTYYLEMNAPSELKAKAKPGALAITEAEIKDFRLNRFLYQLVGEAWQWTDKLSWSDRDWQAYAERKDLRTWVAYSSGAIAGYFELEKQADEHVQIVYFGLSPKFIGQGFGAALLSNAIAEAWGWGDTRRVWVHTCSTDHPSALANYQARGFRCYQTLYGEPPVAAG